MTKKVTQNLSQNLSKVTNISHLYGVLKGFPITGQQVKDQSRKVWNY